MYGYQEYIELSVDQILQKVTQEQIFEMVLKENFIWGAKYKSPFRGHSKDVGTCRFEQREDGTILFVDFGEKFLTGETHRNCWKMVMRDNHCDLQGAIKIVCDHFNLPSDLSQYKPTESKQYSKKSEIDPNRRTDITYVAKPFNKFDVQYWSQFLIRPEHCEEDETFAVRRYDVDSPTKGHKMFTPYKYCYAINVGLRVKIYQPYQIDGKFITNFDQNTIGNLQNLQETGDELIIQKSYKDHRVVRNLLDFINVIYLHNEGSIPSEEILRILIKRFRLITIFFDGDEVGIRAALALYDVIYRIIQDMGEDTQVRVVHLPIFVNRKLTHKDPSDFVHKEGRHDTVKVLKHILWESTSNYQNNGMLRT